MTTTKINGQLSGGDTTPATVPQTDWLALGVAAHQAGRRQEAERAYRHLINQAGDNSQGLCLLGVLIGDMGGKPEEGADLIEAALDRRPDVGRYWFNLGRVRMKAKQLILAERAFRRSLALEPDVPFTLLEIADILEAKREDRQLVMEYVERALALGGGSAPVLTRAGSLLASFADGSGYGRAEELYRKAIQLAPEDSVDAHLFLGVLLLRQGRFAEGWRETEYRFAGSHPRVVMPQGGLGCPRWQGEALVGKRLLLCAEQGPSDMIQFVRYAQLLHAKGATVDVAGCTAQMHPLLQSAVGVTNAYEDMPDREDYDYWVPMMSVPRVLGTTQETIPATVPYFRSNIDKGSTWRNKLDTLDRSENSLRVGLVWAGRPTHLNDMFRSVAHLGMLARLGDVPGITWVSLQMGEARNQLPQVAGSWNLNDVTADFDDYLDTAAVVQCLDLLIAVDTSVAHLAGALGKPVWLMLGAHRVDWRWQIARSDTPWYPSMRLFHQDGSGWGGVASAVADALTIRVRALSH